MVRCFAKLNTPIFVKNQEPVISPIIYRNKAYVLNLKFTKEIFNQINIFEEFVENIRNKGYIDTKNWLKTKKLLNEPFLEIISDYSFDYDSKQKIVNFCAFSKNSDNTLNLNSSVIKDSLKNVLIYTHIKNDKEKFNCFVAKELKKIKTELQITKTQRQLKLKEEFLKENFIKNIGYKYLKENNFQVLNELVNIENITINYLSENTTDDICLYKIASPKDFINSKYKLSDIIYSECIRPDTSINFLIKNSDFYAYKPCLDWILNKSKELIDDKINFTYDYFSNLAFKNVSLELVGFVSQNNSVKNKQCKNTDNNLNFSEVHKHHFKYCMQKIQSSNFIVDSYEKLLNQTTILNLEPENINLINKIIFNDNQNIKSTIIDFVFDENNFPQIPINYLELST
ncbi:MAG: hypothetical protein PHV68_00250 [Candidatus Gastranaerophilales bacterium]|nr:hypothetical protein [Candidatus Gastranaerophilales bacterium]